MNDKELADELDARDRLRKRGLFWKACSLCHGCRESCPVCRGKGGFWEPALPTVRLDPDTERSPSLFAELLHENLLRKKK